jgi:diaminopimelate epimerase
MSSLEVTLTKHSGLGNDFLVVEVPTEHVSDWPGNARTLCNRTTGIGADGLLLLSKIDDENLTMRLYNSDGSLAEMSGNGIRCLAQAAYLLYGHVGNVNYIVATDAGPRHVEVQPLNDTTIHASVDMGLISALDEPANWNLLGTNPDRPVAHISVGNPHSVVGVEDVREVPLKELGEKVPQINLEIIEPGPESNAITMRVHERGAGITQACGTGACASAWAAVQWGLVPAKANEVIVHRDGGDVRVKVNAPQTGHVTLIGPAEYLSTHKAEIVL